VTVVLCLLAIVSAAAADELIQPVRVLTVQNHPPRITIDETGVAPTPGRRLILAGPGGLIGWCEQAAGGGPEWRAPRSVQMSGEPAAYRAWCVQPHLVAGLASRWPSDLPLAGTVDSVSSDGASAWVGLGAWAGVRVGDRFLRLAAGQPVARFDVRYVADDLSYCAVIPLAAGAAVSAREQVRLWPGPGQKREGRAESWVSFVKAGETDPQVWIPAPMGVDAPDDPAVDFFRDGRYVGFGIADRRDGTFWYVREVVKARENPEDGPRVGDLARVRTRADIAAGRIAARVFGHGPEGYQITAGEDDGVRVGQQVEVWRGGRRLGMVQVIKVQGAYSMVAAVGAGAGAGAGSGTQRDAAGPPPLGSVVAPLVRMDEIRIVGAVTDSPKSPIEIGRVQRTFSDGLVQIDLKAEQPAIGTILLLGSKSSGGQGACFLASDGHRLRGLAVCFDRAGSPAIGDTCLSWN